MKFGGGVGMHFSLDILAMMLVLCQTSFVKIMVENPKTRPIYSLLVANGVGAVVKHSRTTNRFSLGLNT